MSNPNTFRYQRLVVAYHGCDLATRDKVVAGKEHLKKSEKDYDWLGRGIYFWEHGHDRALRWAQQRKGKSLKSPSVVGALIQLGNCFDLLDTTYTQTLAFSWPRYLDNLNNQGKMIPQNKSAGSDDLDHVVRNLDCAMVNWTITQLEKAGNPGFDTVRGVFPEGDPAFPGSYIQEKSHIQIAVRNPDCILGYFIPS